MSSYSNSFSLSDLCSSGDPEYGRYTFQDFRHDSSRLPDSYYGGRPACFDSQEQWKQWSNMNRACTGSSHYCNDCLPEYAEKMREEGRCAHRVVKFYWIQGGIVGCAKEPSQHDGEYDKASEDEKRRHQAANDRVDDEPWV